MVIVTDISQEFSARLEEIMKKRGVFSEETHIYLTDLLERLITDPSINPQAPDAFVKQFQNANELDERTKYFCFREIGDTVLFAVGYWPESISSTLTSAKPELDYYATIGALAYTKAHNINQSRRLKGPETLGEIGCRFNEYAAVLHRFRNNIGDVPIHNIDVLYTTANYLQEGSGIDRYMLDADGNVFSVDRWTEPSEIIKKN